VVEAELALIAEVHDPPGGARPQLLGVPVDFLDVESLEQLGEGRAEVITPPAAGADVEDPPEVRIDLARVPELRRANIERQG